MFKLCLLLCVLAIVTHAYNECDRVKAMDSFNQTRFMGEWYQIAQYERYRNQEPEEPFPACVKLTLDRNTDQQFSMGVWLRERDIKGPVKTYQATCTRVDMQAKFTISEEGTEAPMNIVETDYDTFAMLWSCVELEFQLSVETAWIWARKPALEKPVLQLIMDVWKNFEVYPVGFNMTEQQGCEYESLST